jgi:hypothetical protein
MHRRSTPEKIFGMPLHLGVRAARVTLLAVTLGAAIAWELLHPGFHAVTGITLLSQVPLYFAGRYLRAGTGHVTRPGGRRGGRPRGTRITDAQVYALIDGRYHSVTVRRLADATHTSDAAAEKKLREMAVAGKLESWVPEEKYEVHYTEPGRQLSGR